MLIWVHTVTINHNGLRNNSTPFGTQAKAQDFVDACERADNVLTVWTGGRDAWL